MSAKTKPRHPIKVFAIELGLYAVFVILYFFAVLHFLGGWLKALFDQPNRTAYAIIALVVIVVQGVALESLTSWSLRAIQNKLR
jgi:hypothetical protein